MNSVLKALLVVPALTFGIGAMALPIVGQGDWESTLQARDVNADGATDAYYDVSLNITWLANANLAGELTWTQANEWADSLVVGGYSNWRLPVVSDFAQSGFNPSAGSSELAHMYYATLGNLGSPNDQGSPDDGFWGLSNTADFIDVRRNPYWSGSLSLSDNGLAWAFSNYFGYQGQYDVNYHLRAWAVRDGDVLVTAVPEPSTYALMLCGIAGLAIARRKMTGRWFHTKPES